MAQQSHDHNFKNLFLDFPKESLEWSLPQAQNYYHVDNPVVKILLPKMRYEKKDRVEVIREAYNGLYQLASIYSARFSWNLKPCHDWIVIAWTLRYNFGFKRNQFRSVKQKINPYRKRSVQASVSSLEREP